MGLQKRTYLCSSLLGRHLNHGGSKMKAAAFDEMTCGGKHSGEWKDRSLAKGE